MTFHVKRLNRILSMVYNDIRKSDIIREIPLKWSIMHMYSASQIGKILGYKRGLDVEICGLIGALHDLYTIETGKRENHDTLSERYIRDLILRYNSLERKKLPEITEIEENTIINSVITHSQIDIYTNDLYSEFIKDLDSFDRYFHGLRSDGEYLDRCKNVFHDFNIEFKNTDILIRSDLTKYLTKKVKVKIDRSLGTSHPEWKFIYPINYGYLENTISGDGEEIDAYVIGEFEPLDEFEGHVVAVIVRRDDNEDKLVVSKKMNTYSKEQILALVEFQERYFDIEIICL